MCKYKILRIICNKLLVINGENNMRGTIIERAVQAKNVEDDVFFAWLTREYSTASEMAEVISELSGQKISLGAVTMALKRRGYSPVVKTHVKWSK